jgi:hypothetical protein
LCAEVRLCALEALVDYTAIDGKWADFEYLMDIAEDDPDPGVRFALVRMLCDNPPFRRASTRHRLDREELAHRIWKLFRYYISIYFLFFFLVSIFSNYTEEIIYLAVCSLMTLR